MEMAFFRAFLFGVVFLADFFRIVFLANFVGVVRFFLFGMRGSLSLSEGLA